MRTTAYVVPARKPGREDRHARPLTEYKHNCSVCCVALFTSAEYYYGARNDIQRAVVQNILNGVVKVRRNETTKRATNNSDRSNMAPCGSS